MTVPSWVRETLEKELQGGAGEILECQVLEEGAFGKMAVVSTPDRPILVRRKLFGGEVFNLEFMGGTLAGGPTELVPKGPAVQPAAERPSKVDTSVPETFGDVHPIIDVEGIGPTYEERLTAIGIETTHQLVTADTRKVAEATGVSTKVADGWKRMAELIALDGIGPQYAELLNRVDMGSIPDLARTDPEALLSRIHAKEDELDVRIQGNVVGAKRVTGWINIAREHLGLDPIEVPSVPPAGSGERSTQPTPTPEATITGIKGIGPKRTEQLAALGIRSLPELAGADPRTLVEELGVAKRSVVSWQRQADLTSIKGIGQTRANRLHELGIATVSDLVEAKAEGLAQALDTSEKTVSAWQEAALDAVPELTDLTSVDGIGTARANALLSHGLTSKRALKSADPARLAEGLGVSEKVVKGWQANA